MRAKSLFLLSQVRRLTAQWYPGEPASAEWDESYWALMEALATHRSFVTFTLTKMAFYPEMRAMILGMKVCAVITLTAFLEMTSLFWGEQPELQRKSCAVVMEIVSISASLSEEDCAFLDPILLVNRFASGDVRLLSNIRGRRRAGRRPSLWWTILCNWGRRTLCRICICLRWRASFGSGVRP